MTNTVQADVASSEPPTQERTPEVYARGLVGEDDSWGCEYLDDRLRLDD